MLGMQNPPKQPPTQEHASRLHGLADQLGGINSNLSSFLDRIIGPRPTSGATEPEQPNPSGALMIAQFGAQRIANQIDLLRSLVSELDQIA